MWSMGPIALVGLAAALPPIGWDPTLRQYVDDAGRARLFHGVNVVYKKAPWYPPYFPIDSDKSLGEADMKDLRRWGHNVVRLGVMWPGVEPSHGHIDRSYLERMKDIVQKLGAYGIYSIIDLHQDVGSRRFCGEGIPEHYVDALLQNESSTLARAQAFPLPRYPTMKVDEKGYPSMEDCLKNNFGDYYDSESVGALFKELYTPGSPLNEGFLRYWDVVSKTFRDSTEVIGYELLNEPPTLCLSDPEDCRNDKYPYRFGHKQEDKYLVPLYKAAAERIRQNDPRHIIMYESTFYPKIGLDTDAFGEPPLGSDPHQALSYHIYCPIGWVMNDHVCKVVQALYENMFLPWLDKNHGVGGFMTEFGAISGSSSDLANVDRLLDWADSRFQSWAYWQYKFYHDYTTMNQNEAFYDRNGDLETLKVQTLSRTYPQAIAGVPVHMAFNSKTGEFDLEYTPNPNITKNTEIYMNKELYYRHGYTVELSPSGCWDTHYIETKLEIQAKGQHRVSQGTDCQGNVKLSLKPAAPHVQDTSEILV
jgi:endoglycosylceramidase